MEEVRSNGSVAARYKYLADGTKLEVSDPLGGGYLYFGSLIYNKRGNIYEPESTGFAGGRVVFTSSGSDVQYHVTDYLGSVRVVADRDGKLLEKIDYYPFGKRIETAQQQVTGNRYLFNGKEWQSTGRVNLLDYGARMYDPDLGRWLKQDPIYQMQNPYSFCFSNPINFIDRLGLWAQSPNGVVSEGEKDIEEILRDIEQGTFKSSAYYYRYTHQSDNGHKYMTFWLFYMDNLGQSGSSGGGGGSGPGADWIKVADKMAYYAGIAGTTLSLGGGVTTLCGCGIVGVPMAVIGTGLSIASDVIYVATALYNGNYGSALFRGFTSAFFGFTPLKLGKFVNIRGKSVLQIGFTSHEVMVDEVSNQVKIMEEKRL